MLHQRVDLGLHLVDILLDQKPPVDGDHTAIRHAGRWQAGITLFRLGKPAMDAVDVEG